MNKEDEYDSDDDVSIRSLFSSMGSVDDDYHFNDENHFDQISKKNNASKMPKTMPIQNGIEFNSKSMFNLSLNQNHSKIDVKFPNIPQNRRTVKLENYNPNIFNNSNKNKPVLVNANPNQFMQIGLIQKVVYTNPKNRFMIAVPNVNQFKNQVVFPNRNNVRLVPIIYDSSNNVSPNKTVKIVHNDHFKDSSKNEKIVKSKKFRQNINSKNGLNHENKYESNSRHFIESDFFQSTPSFDYHEASQYFSYNENIGDIEKRSFFKKSNNDSFNF
jgi:hypothetical protein